MTRIRSVFRVLCFAIAFAFFADGAAAQTGPDHWTTTDLGDRWVYDVRQAMEFSMGGQPVPGQTRSATDVQRVARRGRLDGLARKVAVIDSDRTWQGDGGDDAEGDFRMVTSADPGAQLEIAVDFGAGFERFEQPLVNLPARIAAGATWTVGTLEQNGMVLDIRGEILGLQDAKTPAGTYERCLKVRYSGGVSGTIEIEGGQLPIQNGTFTADFWYAAGIGHVLSEEVLETKVLTTRGALDTKVTERMSLKGFRSGDSAPARRSN